VAFFKLPFSAFINAEGIGGRPWDRSTATALSFLSRGTMSGSSSEPITDSKPLSFLCLWRRPGGIGRDVLRPRGSLIF